MNKCDLCNKSFEFKSHLERHKNKKTPCIKLKEELNCELCNINFKCNTEKLRHEKTKKHITNVGNNNININGDNNNVNINIYNFPEGTKPFSETNLDAISLADIKYLLQCDNKLINILNEFKTNDDIYPGNTIYVTFFKYFIKIFKKLNFNLAHTENNNCAIFSFSKTHNDIIEYYLLEIDNKVHQYKTKKIGYLLFMEEFINLLKRVDNEFKCDDFKFLLTYIIRYKRILNDDYTKLNIETELLNEYNLFNGIKDEKTLEDEELSRARILFLKKAWGNDKKIISLNSIIST
jgi:hypothetical protein